MIGGGAINPAASGGNLYLSAYTAVSKHHAHQRNRLALSFHLVKLESN